MEVCDLGLARPSRPKAARTTPRTLAHSRPRSPCSHDAPAVHTKACGWAHCPPPLAAAQKRPQRHSISAESVSSAAVDSTRCAHESSAGLTYQALEPATWLPGLLRPFCA